MVIMRLIQHCLTHPSKKCNGGWKTYDICSMSSIIRPLRVCICSDASNLTWGSSLGEQETGEHWNDSEINFYINTKEILAVYFSLKSFASKFKSVSVKLCIDNTTIVAAICHMGASHNDIINKYTKYTWE